MIGEGIHTQLAHLLQPAQGEKETLHEKPICHKEKSTALLVNTSVLLQTPSSLPGLCQHKNWAFRSSPFPNRQLLYQDMLETGLKTALTRLLRISLKSSHLKTRGTK